MSIISALPYSLTNGTTADATQVMANFTQIYNNVNANAVGSGVNSSITSLTGLTTPLSAAQGGTGSASPTANCVAIGEGTSSAFNFVGPGTAGQALGSNGSGSDPSFQGGFVPSGASMWWPTASVPTGWLEANGQATTGYTALAAIYGSNLPDMRGTFARGWDHARGLDPNAPALLAYVADQLGPHTHTITDPTHVHNLSGNSNGSTGGASPLGPVGGSGYNTSTGVSAASTGITINSTSGTETAPKYMAWMFIIKT